MYLCYKRAVAKANALVYEAGERRHPIILMILYSSIHPLCIRLYQQESVLVYIQDTQLLGLASEPVGGDDVMGNKM